MYRLERLQRDAWLGSQHSKDDIVVEEAFERI
jgi:hypothetical protein